MAMPRVLSSSGAFGDAADSPVRIGYTADSPVRIGYTWAC